MPTAARSVSVRVLLLRAPVIIDFVGRLHRLLVAAKIVGVLLRLELVIAQVITPLVARRLLRLLLVGSLAAASVDIESGGICSQKGCDGKHLSHI